MQELLQLTEAKFSTTKNYFHGGYIHPNAQVIFFTSDFDIAKEFVDSAPTPKGEFTVIEANLSIKKPASLAVLKRVIKQSGLTDDDLTDLLDHDVEDETDYLSSPIIVNALKEAGYDGVVAKGIFNDDLIDEFIVFSQSQIKIIKTHVIEE